MPNHITNILTVTGDKNAVAHFFSSIASRSEDDSEKEIDFNRIIPMPESLKIESGSSTEQCIEIFLTALNRVDSIEGIDTVKRQAYLDQVDKLNKARYFSNYNGSLSDDEIKTKIESLLEYNSEEFTCVEDVFKRGITVFENLCKYGAKDWYDWSTENWGTKWNAYSTAKSENTIVFDTAWSAPLPIFNKLAEMFPDISFEVDWADEDMGSNTGSFVFKDGVSAYVMYDDHSTKAYETYIKCKGESECLYVDENGNYKHRNCDECDGC